MSPKNLSVATLSRLFAILVGLIMWAGCGGSSSTTTTTGSPAVTLSASSLTFSSQAVGTTSAAQTVTVTDSGTASLTFTSITLTAGTSDFSLSPSNTCGTGIGAGGTCTIYVTFTPPAAASGTLTGTLTITDNASPSTQPVSLSGTAAVPTVSVLPASLTFPSQGVGTSSASQPVTVSNTGTVPLTINSIAPSGDFSETNTCPSSSSTLAVGTSCTINVTFTPSAAGTRTGTLTITDNASPSTQMVSLTGTGAAGSVSLSPNTPLTFASLTVGSTSAPQSVTLTNMGTLPLTISSIALGGTDSVDFALASGTGACTYMGETLPVSAQCTVYVTFTPQASGTLTGAVTITDDAGGVTGSTQTISLTGTGFSNTVPVTVGFGLPGNTGSSSTNYYNAIYTTVTVCEPGTTTCTSIPNVLVDTGSVGLRILSNQLGSVSLQNITDSSGDILYGCLEFGDGSYTWGPMQMATVQVGGETASQVPLASGGTANSGIPIQVITAGGTAPTGASCASGVGGSDNSVDTLGANGLLGVGNYPQDCGAYCESTPSSYSSPPWLYILCTSNGSSCGYAEPVPLADQAWNPVAAFSSLDTNGVVLQLPSIPAAGAATVTGTLTFGIGTETNNAIPSTATTYELDGNGNFASTLFYGVTYTSAGFLDSGSSVLFVSDYATLNSLSAQTGVTSVVDCTDNGLYCPSSTLNLSLTNYGYNGTSGVMNLSIGNADSLLSANPSFGAFYNIGTDSGTDPSTDYFDYGLPFFFGNTIFVGIAGGATLPNGYWAF